MIYKDLSGLRRALTREIDRQLDPIYERLAREAHDEAIAALINHIEFHKVSQEFNEKGDLYGLFGFEYPQDPVQELIDYLRDVMKVRVYGPVVNGNVRIAVNFPTKEDFRQTGRFALKWEAGKSWIEAVEFGIPNWGQFLPKKGLDQDISRSTQGIQVKGNVNAVPYTPHTDYLSTGIRIYREIFTAGIRRRRLR